MGKPLIIERDNQITIHFDDMMDLYNYEPENDNINREHFHKYMKTNQVPNEKKCGMDFQEVIDSALIGNDSLFESLSSKIEQLRRKVGVYSADYEQEIKISKRKLKKTNFGDELDIHQVYQGNLERAWRTTERVTQDQKHNLVTLLVDIGGNWGESADKSLWRAAVVSLAVDELQKAGKTVQVVVGDCGDGSYRKCPYRYLNLSINVKRYNEYLSLPRLASMCNLGFFRVFGFACIAVHPRYEVASGLGSHVSFSLERRHIPYNMLEDIEAGKTSVCLVNACKSLESAAYVLRNLYAQLKAHSEQ